MKQTIDVQTSNSQNNDSLSTAKSYSASRTFRVLPIRILRYLVSVFSVLSVANLLIVARLMAGQKPPIFLFEKFYFDREANFPSFFSALILLFASLLLLLIAAMKRKDRDAFQFHWLALGGIFLFLSVDETVGLHETLIEPLRNLFHLKGYLYLSWVLVGGLFVIVFLAAYTRFLLNLNLVMRSRFMLSGFIYVLGAIVFEMLGSHFYVESSQDLDVYHPSAAYLMCMTIEETLEMIGVLIFISTLFAYLQTYARSLRLNVIWK